MNARFRRRLRRRKHRPYKTEVLQNLSGAIDTAELMGLDTTNAELMGGFLKKIIGKIKAKRAQRIADGNEKDFALSTPAGTLNVGDSGVGFTAKSEGASDATGTPSSGIIPGVSNKILIGGAVAVAAGILLIKRK